MDSDRRWWEASPDDMNSKVMDIVRHLDQEQRYRGQHNLRALRLYGNKDYHGINGRNYTRVREESRDKRVTYNVVKACIDTAQALIAKNKHRALFLTEDGDFGLQQRARRLTQFVDGVYYDQKLYRSGRRIFKDACLFSKGIHKVYGDAELGKVVVERVFPDELLVDDEEARYGEPRTIFQRVPFQKHQLEQLYPEFKAEIGTAPLAKDASRARSRHGYDAFSETIEVIEAWHLPSKPGATDGRHALIIDNAVLFHEDYERDSFPFAYCDWDDPVLGFWGISLSDELIPIQREINVILRRMIEYLRRIAVPRVYLQSDSNIAKAHINNLIGAIIRYQGAPPTFETPSPIPESMWMMLQDLVVKAFQMVGVSELSATSKKPAGLNSGAALREYDDIETERFSVKAANYQDFHMKTSELIVQAAKELYTKDDVNVEVKAAPKGRKFIRRIKWSDVDLEESQFQLQPFPVNLLPKTPAGRLATVQEMIGSGLLDPQMAMSLLDFPDLEAYQSMVTAPLEDIKATIEDMLDYGRYQVPEPFQNLELGKKMVLNAYLKAKRQGAPDDRLELLRMWIEDADFTITEAMPPIEAVPPAGGPPPMNGAGPPPAPTPPPTPGV